MSKEVRIVALKDGSFIPQKKVKHFLWGHHWDGLYIHENGNLYSSSGDFQLDKCAVSSEEEALKVLSIYTDRLEAKRKLNEK